MNKTPFYISCLIITALLPIIIVEVLILAVIGVAQYLLVHSGFAPFHYMSNVLSSPYMIMFVATLF